MNDMAAREELATIVRKMEAEIRTWERKYGLAVQGIRVLRTGVSDDPCDMLDGLGFTLGLRHMR